MGDPGSEIIECIPPAGPEASESTVEENEDDIQFVSEGPLRPVLEYIDLVSSDDDEPSTSQREMPYRTGSFSSRTTWPQKIYSVWKKGCEKFL
uniref:Zinc finger protein 451 n=3 Tax=Bos TaxID=9903 RepID=A0ABI0NRB5_BOVIN